MPVADFDLLEWIPRPEVLVTSTPIEEWLEQHPEADEATLNLMTGRRAPRRVPIPTQGDEPPAHVTGYQVQQWAENPGRVLPYGNYTVIFAGSGATVGRLRIRGHLLSSGSELRRYGLLSPNGLDCYDPAGRNTNPDTDAAGQRFAVA